VVTKRGGGSYDYVIEIPETSDALSPLITTIPLQLLSSYCGIERM
jgi:glucosamine--fructose-6-phosphate aminotransferase (isomerizing)